MSGEIVEADHHNEDHNGHGEFGGNQIWPKNRKAVKPTSLSLT